MEWKIQKGERIPSEPVRIMKSKRVCHEWIRLTKGKRYKEGGAKRLTKKCEEKWGKSGKGFCRSTVAAEEKIRQIEDTFVDRLTNVKWQNVKKNQIWRWNKEEKKPRFGPLCEKSSWNGYLYGFMGSFLTTVRFSYAFRNQRSHVWP